ncbi:hypothetical protein PENVUL_c031G01552, partial [Penicillium vulpinum]
MAYINHVEQSHEALILLPSEQFSEAISNYTCCRHPAHLYSTLLDFLAEPIVVNIDISKLRFKS